MLNFIIQYTQLLFVIMKNKNAYMVGDWNKLNKIKFYF